jgi:hypothetical protein
MKRQKSCGPRLGKLVHQLPGAVTFSYYLHFRRTIARWKGLSEEYTFRCYLFFIVASPKNDPASQGPEN